MPSNGRLFQEARDSTEGYIEAVKRANALIEDLFKEEMTLLDRINPGMETIPNWGMFVYNDLPDWGREPCAHRWTDGLFELLEMISQEKHWQTTAGRCGDMTGAVGQQAEALAAAVEAWLAPDAPAWAASPWVNETLGERSPEKEEAARCFVDLVRAALSEPKDVFEQKAAAWREKGALNEVLERIFFDGGLDEKLENPCGFLLIRRLKNYLQIIGGDTTPLAATRWWCNTQLRDVWREDPDRVLVTQGCLWGLHAVLNNWSDDTLRARVPWCASSALYAARILRSRPSTRPPLTRWLVTSMLIKTRHWYLRMINFANDGALPPMLMDVPESPFASDLFPDETSANA